MQTQGSTDDGLQTALRRKWWQVTGIAGAVVAALMITLIITAKRDENVAVVEDFFAALEERDVKTALSLVNPDAVPSGDEAAFLKPEAIADNWSLSWAKLKSRRSAVAIVTARFDTEGLTRTADYKVLTGRNPRLANPFIGVDFGYSPLTYAQANDRTVPMKSLSENETARYLLFPGSYTFYKDVPDSVKLQEEPRLIDVFDGHNFLDSEILPEALSLKPKAESDVRAEFDERLAECLKSRQLKPENCPFGAEEDWVLDNRGTVIEDPQDLEWKLTEEPKVSFSEVGSDIHIQGIAVITDPATAPLTLTGIGDSGDGESVKFTAKCSIDSETWVVMIDKDGKLELDDYRAEEEPDPVPFQTCGGSS